MMDDPFGTKKGTIAKALAEAREESKKTKPSLKNPSRPFTPMNETRPLFGIPDTYTQSRPTSAVGK
jgi:hypothetical protein